MVRPTDRVRAVAADAVVEVGEAAGETVAEFPPMSSPVSEAGLRKTTLANGLTVVSEFMPSVRSVALGAWVRSASVHEPVALTGISHMLEHLVFKGTHRRSAREIALALERLGGSLDAYTGREHIAFQARVLDEHLEQAADVMSDLLFSPALRAVDLDLERRVVLEEISMVEDDPSDLVFELHNELLWGPHPLGYSILGTRDSVGALRLSDLQALHRRAFHPAHIVVSAAGHVEHDELLGALERSEWGAARDGAMATAVMPPAVASAPTVRHVERASAQSHLVLGCPTMGYGDSRRHAMTLASIIVGGGMSSLLFQKIREEMGLAYSIHSFHSYFASVGMHGVYAATSPEEAPRALEAIRAELVRVAERGVPEEDFAVGKGLLKGQLTLSLESPASRLYRAAATELYGEPFRPLDDALALIDAVSPDDVAAVAREYFDPSRWTVLSLGPGGSLS
jgi:predicted Zn-dependent peptidase